VCKRERERKREGERGREKIESVMLLRSWEWGERGRTLASFDVALNLNVLFAFQTMGCIVCYMYKLIKPQNLNGYL
jgi:hypothetical protein